MSHVKVKEQDRTIEKIDQIQQQIKDLEKELQHKGKVLRT